MVFITIKRYCIIINTRQYGAVICSSSFSSDNFAVLFFYCAEFRMAFFTSHVFQIFQRYQPYKYTISKSAAWGLTKSIFTSSVTTNSICTEAKLMVNMLYYHWPDARSTPNALTGYTNQIGLSMNRLHVIVEFSFCPQSCIAKVTL